jgi:GNAT superfamily N-acetyltransferase
MSDGDIVITLTRVASPQVGPFVLRAYVDLFDRGLFDGRFTVKPDHHALLIEREVARDLVPAAVAVFMVAVETRVLWVDLLYVKEEFRGQGLCKRLIAGLNDIGRQSEVLELQYGVDLKNTAMRSVAKRLGHSEFAVLMKGGVGP